MRGTEMASFKYFAEQNGQAVQLSNVGHDGHISTKANHFFGFAPNGSKLQAVRQIEFKSNPSLHVCGPRCTEAKGFLCECSCGGKNHGRGSFVCEEAA
jgi:hypothetical protein